MGKHLQGAFASRDPSRFAASLERSEDVAGTLNILLDIPDGLEGAVVNQLSSSAANRILGQVSDSTLIEWLESGAVEDSRQIVSKLAPDRADTVTKGIRDNKKRRELRRRTAYSEDSIGRLMKLDMILLLEDDTVEEIDAQIKQYKGSPDGPIVIQHNDGRFAGVLDPIRFLQNHQDESTALDSCIRLEPVFANSPAAILLDSSRWAGQSKLPVVDYDRKPIGYITRSALEGVTRPKSVPTPGANTLVKLSTWYWSVLLQATLLALDRRPER